MSHKTPHQSLCQQMQHASTQFTGCTGRKAQILTLNMGQQREAGRQAPYNQ
jgi:hypothetical protein